MKHVFAICCLLLCGCAIAAPPRVYNTVPNPAQWQLYQQYWYQQQQQQYAYLLQLQQQQYLTSLYMQQAQLARQLYGPSYLPYQAYYYRPYYGYYGSPYARGWYP